MPTTNLNIDYLSANTGQPEVVINEALDDIDYLQSMFTKNMTSDADYTLLTTGTHPEWSYGVFKITDTSVLLTTTRSIKVPLRKKFYHVWNATAQSLTFKPTSGTGITVAASMKAILYCDGTNVVRFGPDV